MGRTPCCLKQGLNRGAWTAKEDMILTEYVETHGETGWRTLPKKAGLNRCGKSCRLRWLNYLRPNIKRGNISADEEDLILRLHRLLGNRWALIAGRLPGRTDNEIKNYWNSHLSKKLAMSNVDPKIHKPMQKAARTPFSPKANFPVQKPNSPSETFTEKCNINVIRLAPVKRQDDTVAPFTNNVSSNGVGTGDSAGMPLCIDNHDQVDLSKSWSQLLQDTCAYNDHGNSELIDIRLGSVGSEACLEAETHHCKSFNIPFVCTSSSPVNTECEKPGRLFGCSNSVQRISRLNDSYPDTDCVPLTDVKSTGSKTIEEFCMESLLIETPDCDLEEIYQPLERNDCNETFDHNMDCFAMGAAAEPGMSEIYNNTLQLDWTHKLLEQCLHKQSTVDLDGSLDHLLGFEHQDLWNDGLMINSQHSKTNEDNYVDIIMDLSLEE